MPNKLTNYPCQNLKGVGQKNAQKLANLGINTLQDLLFHLPSRYQDRTRVHPIRSIKPGDHVGVEGIIESITYPIAGKTKLLMTIKDNSGNLTLRFFYINAAQRQTFKTGMKIHCFGEVRRGPKSLEMVHPEYKLNQAETLTAVEEMLTPVYPTTDGLSQLTLRNLTNQALNFLKAGAALQDILPEEILSSQKFPKIEEALQYVHRPPPDAPIDTLMDKQHITQKRLVFEELLAHRLSLLHVKETFQTQNAFVLLSSGNLTENFLKQLPFKLTNAQSRVVADIQNDLTKPHPMLRLVQGDVGSGKTVIAALAMLQAVENTMQCAMLAPTEILAEQHYQTLERWLTPLNVNVALLTGQLPATKRQQIETAVASGQVDILIGTHAIFQKNITFAKLALCVIDEQHRFGVQQRAQLREKGLQENNYPHQLIMTATPIPRTLAMSVYADLDYSVIDELPPGRTPINTTVVANTRRDDVLARIREACASGKQGYWVCTLIEESEVLQCQAAENTYQEMQATFPELKIGLIHGRLKNTEKENIMQAFKSGALQLLVATTVIEVGVDVPNASLMIIENAERLGLAQLHQLRGRVGRGEQASHCVLLYQHPLSMLAKQRLAVMRETNDGFKIAQRDLEIRGPGEVLGTRQTGDISMRIANLLRDNELLPAVQQAATLITQKHTDVIAPLIQRWLGKAIEYGQV